MTAVALPPEVETVFRCFLTCEFTTLGKGGVPVAWPTLPTYWTERGQFVIASPVALSQKAVNVRRDPRVSLLYSNPTGSGLAQPPIVLVQGEAHSPDEVRSGVAGLPADLLAHLAAQGKRIMQTQPSMRVYLANPLTRAVMAWYFLRVFIYITPRRITWWARGDLAREPQRLEVTHVALDC